MGKGKCKACDQWITWGTNERGKNMPFDDQPLEGRKYVVIGDQAGYVTTCHWDTCPAREKRSASPRGGPRNDKQQSFNKETGEYKREPGDDDDSIPF